jgi:hypothetical protein
VAIHILGFFDRHGFTIRRQDLRRINPARVEVFASKSARAESGGVLLPVGLPRPSNSQSVSIRGGQSSPPSRRKNRRVDLPGLPKATNPVQKSGGMVGQLVGNRWPAGSYKRTFSPDLVLAEV